MTTKDSTEKVRARLYYNNLARALVIIVLLISLICLSENVLHESSATLRIVFSLILILLAATWIGYARQLVPPTLRDTALALDDRIKTKERFLTIESLTASPLDQEKLRLIEKQLEQTLLGADLDKLFPIALPLLYRRVAYLLPLIWIAIFLTQHNKISPPSQFKEEAKLIANLIKEENLPTPVKEELQKLGDVLNRDNVSKEEILEVLSSAKGEVEKAKEALLGETKPSSEVAKLEATPTPEPTPTPTATIPASEKQSKEQKEKQKEKNEEEKERPKNDEQQSSKDGEKKENQEGQGKESDKNKQEDGEKGEGESKKGGKEGTKQSDKNEQGKGDGKEGEPEQGSKSESSSESKNDKQSNDSKEEGLKAAEQALEQIKKEIQKSEGKEKQSKEDQKNDQGKGANQKGKEDGKKPGEKKGEEGQSSKEQGTQGDEQGEEKSKDAKNEGDQPGDKKGKDSEAKKDDGNDGERSAEAKTESDAQADKKNEKENDKQQSEKPKDSSLPNSQGEVKEFEGDGPTAEPGKNNEFKETQIKESVEQIDLKHIGKDSESGFNPNEAKPKRSIEDLKLAKPESDSNPESQPLPLEYRDLMR